jgi:iron uptake system component EfeO
MGDRIEMHWTMTKKTIGILGAAILCWGCSSETAGTTPDSYEKQVTDGMRATIAADLAKEKQAAIELMNAAPTPKGRGWDAKEDAQAISTMKAAWQRARTAYERVEGAVAPLFPDIDMATDARYDGFLTALGGQGDPNLFDDSGVTGLHAIERIVYSDQIPASVVAFEETLPGYAPAAFPATEAEAAEFKAKLCQKLVDDIAEVEAAWGSAELDLDGAFGGLIALMNEQREKVKLAATGEEESRYSQRTLADLRDNLEGTRTAYALFAPWIRSKGGEDADMAVTSGFEALAKAYDAEPGDAIPAPPPTWSSIDPSEEDLATPFGELFSVVTTAVDPNREGSIVDEMNDAARLLGYPQLVEEE